jgi:ribosomal protein S18 acetylase RimI-like enzyme
MLLEIQSALRKSIANGAQRVGPFLIRFDDHSDNPFINYAIPDDGARPSPADVAALVAAFQRRGRTPRLEYVAPAPAVDEALAAAGFSTDLRLPLMTMAGGELVPPARPRDVEIDLVSTDDGLLTVAQVQNVAYREPSPAGAHDVTRLRARMRAGGGAALARCGHEPAGAGLFTPPRDGLCEIAGIGVLPEFRRLGIASAMVAEMTRLVFAAGATPHLQTESKNERRLYARLGYRTVGEVVAVGLGGAGS